MKVNELKRILKPLVKECVREVILEEKGPLSHIVTEVVSGLANSQELITEERHPTPAPQQPKRKPPKSDAFAKLREEMIAKVTGAAYKDDVDVVEEGQPESPQQTQPPRTRKQVKLEEFKQKAATGFNGVDIFEGTTPVSLDPSEELANHDDGGVDLNVFENMNNWKDIAKGK